VAQVPWRSKLAEAALSGGRPSEELYARAAAAAVEGARPLSQNAFKLRLAKVALQRALRAALA
jgi:xanthine dehydrogenase YagS FAD-binding subunit